MAAPRSDSDVFFELSNPPTDGISRVKFFHKANRCVISSWDRTVSIHDLTSDDGSNTFTKTTKLCEYSHEAGVLDVTITPDDRNIYSVGCDFALRSFNATNPSDPSQTSLIGYHSAPIRCVSYYSNGSIIITGSWDKTIKLWDARQGNNNNNNNENNGNNNGINNNNNSTAMISSHELSDKIFSMSMQSNNGFNLITATADRLVYIYDLRKMDSYIQRRESSLKHQTRTVVCHPNNLQYVLASIEGRVAVEYLNTNKEWQNKKYAFKCHRQNVISPPSQTDTTNGDNKDSNNNNNGTKMQTIFPVNCVSFHPIYHTFATGGGDGVVNIWDGENKKRICQFPTVNTSISSVDFNNDGSIIAIAKSYTWEKGDLISNGINVEKDTVIFRKISDNQAKPKSKKKKPANQ